MKSLNYVAALAILLFAAPGHASNLKYSMLGMNLTSTQFEDEIDLGLVQFEDAAGATLYGAYQFTDYFFVELSGGAEGNSDEGFEIKTSVGYLAGGFALPVGTATDVVLRLGVVSASAEICYDDGARYCVEEDDGGAAAAAGIRHMLVPSLEINADFVHVDLDEFEDSDTVTVGGAYWFSDHSSLRLSLGNTEGDRNAALGYRYSF